MKKLGKYEILEQIGSLHEAGKYHFNLALIRREQGDTTQARQHFRRAAALFDAAGDSNSADRARQELLKPWPAAPGKEPQ